MHVRVDDDADAHDDQAVDAGASIVSAPTDYPFGERHHFDPPHRVEPERFPRSLCALWSRADG